MTHRSMLCLGGSLRPGSLTSAALREAASRARELGSPCELLTVDQLRLPFLDPRLADDVDLVRPPEVVQLLSAVASAHVVLVGTPVYGGTVSGVVKNMLDTLHLGKNGMRGPLDGKRIGVLSVGGGSLTGRFHFQRAATATLDVACRNLGGWVEARHVELAELSFGLDGQIVDALARAQVHELVHRLLGRPGALDTSSRHETETGVVAS